MKKWLITIFGICVSIAAIALIVPEIEWRQTVTEIESVGWLLPIVLAALSFASFPIRALRWQIMLPTGTLTFYEALKGIVLGIGGNNVLPARGGEFLRMEYLYRKAPHIGRITAISSVLVERMLDGLTLLAILVISVNASHVSLIDHPWLGELRWAVLLLFGMACLGSIVIRIWGGKIAALLRLTHFRAFAWAATMIDRFHVAAEFLGFNRYTAATVILGFIIWLIEGSVYVLACWHFGLGARSVVAGYLTLTILNFGLLIPASPGNAGLFEFFVMKSLSLFGVPEDVSLALGVVVHVCQFLPTTLWGLAIFLRESLGWTQRRIHTAHEVPLAPH